jgi:isobutyryl-CoA mutase
VMRSTDAEKQAQIDGLSLTQRAESATAAAALTQLQQDALRGGNVFASLMEAAKVCSLGQMSQALYQVGGQYRRNM